MVVQLSKKPHSDRTSYEPSVLWKSYSKSKNTGERWERKHLANAVRRVRQ